jgi:hypothetical protein
VFKTERAKPSGRDVNCTRKQVTSSKREVGARAPSIKQNKKQRNKYIYIYIKYTYIKYKTEQNDGRTYTLLFGMKKEQIMMENGY